MTAATTTTGTSATLLFHNNNKTNKRRRQGNNNRILVGRRTRRRFNNKCSFKFVILLSSVGLMLLYIEIKLIQEVRNTTTLLTAGSLFHHHHKDDKKTKSHHHHNHHHHGGLPGVLKSSAADLYANSNNNADNDERSSKFLSCNDLFSDYNFQIISTTNRGQQLKKCLQHTMVNNVNHACQLGKITIDKTKIDGSYGGEDIYQVLDRNEQIEKLEYSKGALTYNVNVNHQEGGGGGSSTTRSTTTTSNIFPLPSDTTQWTDYYSDGIIHFLSTGLIISGTTVVGIDHHHHHSTNTNLTLLTNNNSQQQQQQQHIINSTAILIDRGDYANPCMSMLDMYNVYMIIQKFDLQQNVSIIWLDGHAKGNLDDVWSVVFQSQPYHIKQLPTDRTTFVNSVIVNTKSIVGEEGLQLYRWRRGRTNNTYDCSTDPNTNTLVKFRNFVVQRYELKRKTLSSNNNNNNNNKRLTLLVRRHYKAHPRSNGRTDRVLANITKDVEYLKSIHPEYANNFVVVSFENMTFYEQLQHITQTDLLVAVHGAGNIHTLFLPDHATFIEYLPKNYQQRQRFRYFAECLNLTYIAKHPWVVERFERKTKVSLQLQPRSKYEETVTLWHQYSRY